MMKIVVMGGSFNPPTIAHLRLLQNAIRAIGADKGIFVPSSDRYVRNKMKKIGRENQTLPEGLRCQMLEAMAQTDPRLEVDDREFYYTEKKCTYDTMLAIQADRPHDTLYFLAGNDKLSVIPRWHEITPFLDQYCIIVCRRDDEDPEETIAANDFLRARRHHLMVIEAPEGINGISATALREAIEQNDPGMRELCHPNAWPLLTEYLDTIPDLRDEYRFMSNFREAPVTYDGLTYRNNEAAFQAQKTLDQNERAIFTELSASEAKSKGRKVTLRPDWEEVKVQIMEDLVRAKFTQNEDLKKLLLATGLRKIEEGNTWNDTFWGVDAATRSGENHLGMILMKIRDELHRST